MLLASAPRGNGAANAVWVLYIDSEDVVPFGWQMEVADSPHGGRNLAHVLPPVPGGPDHHQSAAASAALVRIVLHVMSSGRY